MPTKKLPGTLLQRQLSEFLYAELLHTLGSYRIARERLDSLLGDLGRSPVEKKLSTAATAALHCNEHLRDHLHRTSKDAGTDDSAMGRHPSPFPAGKRWRLPNAGLLKSISSFYVDSAAALSLHLEDPSQSEWADPPHGHRLGAKLAFIHDPQRRGKPSGTRDSLIHGRLDRNWARLDAVHDLLPRSPKPRRPAVGSQPSAAQNARFEKILGGCADGEHSVLLKVIQALSEAHMWMHEAEHVRAQSFGPMLSSIPETHAKTQRMLRYSLVLNTFVFAAARSTPWIFAEDDAEREHVIAQYEKCCDTLAPTYCMWTATQFSLLALHRRAFTWWTMGKHDRAYRDFYKLTRLLRALRKPAEKRAVRVPGTKTFIEGMTAMSEHHIGRIYRGQHAHRMALRYFERAAHHLRGWEEHAEIGHLVKNSHWRLNLLVNEGKANYELGRVKRSLLHYARAWRAFLLLVESETHASANVDVVERFIEWLQPIADDPELSRKELLPRLGPLVEQFETLRSPAHLRLLAADIVMRVGHLTFVLKLSPDHDLAERCVRQALFLDPTSTLSAADLLRIVHEKGERLAPDDLPDLPLADQWPSGSGRFEEAARITEYTLQRWLAATAPAGDQPQPTGRTKAARELLGSFLAHTDSSNVKLAQVYRYLMANPRATKRKTSPDEHTLDFVCLRRYSSFFPFLPRPSAFRAPGGGYFVQVREAGEKEEPFGIAIDPGPDFIENLYRCGYSLADVHMIVLTHDHADHIASLDAMLALMGYRKRLGDPTFDGDEGRCLAIVGNESVYRRYAFYNSKKHPVLPDRKNKGRKAARTDEVRVMRFEEIGWITSRDGEERSAAIEDAEILLEPNSLRIEPVRTRGHADANGYVSQGFLLSFGPEGNRSSILFTGDTGAPPSLTDPSADAEGSDDPLLAKGSKSLRKAVEEADLVVAHLSSVPLRELRELAGLRSGSGEDETIAQFTDLWSKAAENAKRTSRLHDRKEGIRQTEFLLNQLQFGFRSRAEKDADHFDVSPLSPFAKLKKQPPQHLYLTGLLEIADVMAGSDPERAPLLLIGELREELGTFRTRIASRIAEAAFQRADGQAGPIALTTDIGLRVRMSRTASRDPGTTTVLCTTCDLDNDLVPTERFHSPDEIREVCVKGEDEGVFYNCLLHDPHGQDEYLWVESVERYDVFGE